VSLIVQKFGGTSVADASKIRRAAERAVAARQAGHQVVMVVSARGKKTDELVGLAAEITEKPAPREMDMLLSTGEQESVALMAMAIHSLGEKAVSMTGGQIGVLTDSSHTKARIESIATARMHKYLDGGAIIVACGFQGIDSEMNITTLGRGGSDTTAAALAAALHADVCEIYTDVEGVFSTDPRIVSEARKLERISYDEMLELASVGAGVMHSRSIEFAKKYRVPLRVRPSFSDEEGTLIDTQAEENAPPVRGVALVKGEARVTICDVPDRPGVLAVIFSQMAKRKIPIDLVVQNVGSEGLAEISFTVPQDDLAETLTAAQDAVEVLGVGEVRSGTNVSKVSAVGAGMKLHTGVAAQMFAALSQAGINIEMVTTSEIKISVLVDRDQSEAALRTVHQTFGLDRAELTTPSIGYASDQDNDEGIHAHDEVAREVVAKLANMEDIVVSEVLLDEEQSRVTLRNLPDSPGVAAQLFAAVAEGGIMVDMIVQNISHARRANISFTVPRTDLDQCLLLVRAVLEEWPEAELNFEQEIDKLSVWGIGLRSHTGVGEKMFKALANAEINVTMLSTSEILMSVVVDRDEGRKAHACLTEAFQIET
jgi:aspartate kinase